MPTHKPRRRTQHYLMPTNTIRCTRTPPVGKPTTPRARATALAGCQMRGFTRTEARLTVRARLEHARELARVRLVRGQLRHGHGHRAAALAARGRPRPAARQRPVSQSVSRRNASRRRRRLTTRRRSESRSTAQRRARRPTRGTEGTAGGRMRRALWAERRGRDGEGKLRKNLGAERGGYDLSVRPFRGVDARLPRGGWRGMG